MNETAKTITIDFRTSPEGKELRGRYNGTAAVVFDVKAKTLRFDSLEHDPEDQGRTICDLITHFHSDRINARALGRMYQDAFPAPAVSSAIGPLLYSRYEFEGLTVETFKYLKTKHENTDSLIYKITHNGVSHLLFGDFDDEKALTELLECSKTNEEKREAILGELCHAETEDRKRELREQLDLLPTLRSDVVKWPHNAYIFKSRELIEKMNAVINPRYFIYQAHSAQEDDPKNPKKFKQMIEGLDFKKKFINTAEYDVEIIG
jgi:hypothetical protein